MSDTMTTDNGVVMLAEHTEMISVGSLSADGNQVKEHSFDQIALLCGMMQEFGWTVPILIDRDLNIIAGVGRWKAAQSLGLAKIPCVKVTHLHPDQVKALIIADNKINESAWDTAGLKTLMLDLKQSSEDLLGLTGFDFEEIDDLLDGVITEETDDGEDAPKPKFLDVGSHKIELDPDESKDLNDIIARWVKKTGGYRGFVRTMIDSLRGN